MRRFPPEQNPPRWVQQEPLNLFQVEPIVVERVLQPLFVLCVLFFFTEFLRGCSVSLADGSSVDPSVPHPDQNRAGSPNTPSLIEELKGKIRWNSPLIQKGSGTWMEFLLRRVGTGTLRYLWVNHREGSPGLSFKL